MRARLEDREMIRVGDWVTFELGGRDVLANVLEDRGAIGFQSRRLLRVLVVAAGPGQPAVFELPEEDLRRASLVTLPQAQEYAARYIVPSPFAEIRKGSYCVGSHSWPGAVGEVVECGASFEEAIELFRRRHPEMVVEPE